MTPTDKLLSDAAQKKHEFNMHENPAIAKILHDLHEAALIDDRHSRTSHTARMKGFYSGRADAKRNMISVLAQTTV